MSALSNLPPRISIHLERREPEPQTTLDQLRRITGIALAVLGMAILIGAALTLYGHLMGLHAVPLETIHTVFMTGIACTVAGFHLAREGYPSSFELSL